jgi:hypothetical protein
VNQYHSIQSKKKKERNGLCEQKENPILTPQMQAEPHDNEK